MEGIQEFWNSLTPDVYRKYIRHLHTIIPKVIAVDGNRSGYDIYIQLINDIYIQFIFINV